MIPGFFNFPKFYEFLVQEAPYGSAIVEVGAYLGASFSFLVKQSLLTQKNLRCIAVDHWQDVNSKVFDPSKEGINTFDKFREYMSKENLDGKYEAFQMNSLKAAKLFKDKSLFAVFIDANHEFDNVVQDINAWKPKIKHEGIISGHDIKDPEVERAVRTTLGNYHYLEHCWWVENVL